MSNQFGPSKFEEILSMSQVYRSVYIPLTPLQSVGRSSGDSAEQDRDLECISNVSLFSVPIGSRHEVHHHPNPPISRENNVHGGLRPQANNKASSQQQIREHELRVALPERECESPRGTRYGQHHRKSFGHYDCDVRSTNLNHTPLSEPKHARKSDPYMQFTGPDSHGNIAALANGTRYVIPQDGSPIVIPIHRTSTPPIEQISRRVYERVRTQEFAEHFDKENRRPRRRSPSRHGEPSSYLPRHDSAIAESVRHDSTDRDLGREYFTPACFWETSQAADTRANIFELEGSTPAWHCSPVQPLPDSINQLPPSLAIEIPSLAKLQKSRPAGEREIGNFHDWRAERDEYGRRTLQGQHSQTHTRSMSHGGHVEWCRPSQTRTRSYDVPPPGSSPMPPLPGIPTALSKSRPSSVGNAYPFGPVDARNNNVAHYPPRCHLDDPFSIQSQRRVSCAPTASYMAYRMADGDRRDSEGQREMYIRKMEVSPGKRTRSKVRFVLP